MNIKSLFFPEKPRCLSLILSGNPHPSIHFASQNTQDERVVVSKDRAIQPSKKSQGFTILEVLIALGILVMASAAITNIQMRIFANMQRNQDDVDRVFLLKKHLTEVLLSKPLQTKKEKITIENPATTITIQASPIDKKSSLAVWEDSLVFIHAQADWKAENILQNMYMLGIALKPKEKEKK